MFIEFYHNKIFFYLKLISCLLYFLTTRLTVYTEKLSPKTDAKPM